MSQQGQKVPKIVCKFRIFIHDFLGRDSITFPKSKFSGGCIGWGIFDTNGDSRDSNSNS